METELHEQENEPGVLNGAQTVAPTVESNTRRAPHRHVSPATCASCGAAAESNGYEATAPSFVFAIGRVEMRFPTLAVEKEFAQATSRADTKGLTAIGQFLVLSATKRSRVVCTYD